MSKNDHSAGLAADANNTIAASPERQAHTPGPWAWFGNTKNKEIHLATVHGGRQFVMTFTRYGMSSAQPRFQVGHRMVDAHDLVVYERDYRADIEDINHPDAHLIAAAPELLEFAKKVRAQHAPSGERKRCLSCGLDGGCCGQHNAAEAVIAKAEGRS